ncbi:MAG: polyprenyl synthetase family protein [Candidatus Peregrinibacteria bacterium]|nr:polyprenyl synthetase family protein [Candidatus Peregrinibacteria bacterium]
MEFFKDLRDEVNVELERFFREIPKDCFSEGEKRLFEAAEYGTTLGGKRFRPVFGILCAEACNKNVSRKVLIENLVSIELIHAFSLIHDDLPGMDNDKERRGCPTVWCKFGIDTAILAGDVLQTLAFENLVKKAPEFAFKNLVKVLAESSGFLGMCGGQARDTFFNVANSKKSLKMSDEELMLLHKKKTGALISGAGKFGVILAEADEDEAKFVEEFAENLGLSFQVSDDLLDGDGFVEIWGEERTRTFLAELTERLVEVAKKLNSKELEKLAVFVANRDD